MTRTAITYSLSVSTDGSAARVDVSGPRGGFRWVGEFTEAQLREYALVFEAQADMLHDPQWQSVRCVCVSREHDLLDEGRFGRCAGTGNKDRNNGFCVGCRTPERGIYGVGQPGKHIPMGAGAWPVEWEAGEPVSVEVTPRGQRMIDRQLNEEA